MPKHKNKYRYRQMSVPLCDEEVKCLDAIKKQVGMAKAFYVRAAIREKLIRDGMLKGEDSYGI